MSLVLSLVIITVATTFLVAAMLFARRHTPAGGRFTDTQRAAGVFAVIGTTFAILLGFVVFLAFDSYSHAKTNAAIEATAVADAFQTAELFPTGQDAVQGALICYARTVIHQGWPAMADGRPSRAVDAWSYRLERATDRLKVLSTKQDDAFSSLLSNRDSREEARRERIGAASHTVPTIMWVLLIVACAAPLAFLLFFADPAEPAMVQALLMGSVAALISAALLAVIVLDAPFSGRSGSIAPRAMQYSLGVMQLDRRLENRTAPVPCSADGRPLAG